MGYERRNETPGNDQDAARIVVPCYRGWTLQFTGRVPEGRARGSESGAKRRRVRDRR